MTKYKTSENPPARIWVVEDDLYTNELISGALKTAGFEVVSFFTAEQAFAAVAKKPPELIILDLILPKMDGWEFCRRLRKEETAARRVPIVVASVAARYDFEGMAGMQGLSFFSKPFEPAALVAEVRRILDGSPAQ